jgi:outer membrane protein assembly factor BamB
MNIKITENNARRALLAGLTGVMIMCGLASGGDWPNWRGPDYNGISTETGFNADWPEEGPKVLWEKEIGIGFSSVSVANGKAYVTGNADNKDTVFCFDAATGEELWKKSYDQRLDPKNYEGGTLATPTVADGKVYYISKDGKTFCFDADTGNIDWKKDVSKEYGFKRPIWGFSSSPLVVDDLLILNVGRAGLAIKKTDGSFVWGDDKTPGGYATMVPYTTRGKKYVAMFGFKEILGLEAATGKQIFKHTWETMYGVNAADPIIIGDKIFIASGYKNGCAMLQISGSKVKELWTNDNMRCKMSGPVLIDGVLYGPHQSKGLQALDAATGNLLWEEKEFKQGGVTAADGKLIVISEKGKLAVANVSKEKYDEISSVQILNGRCWTVPVLANGKLYVRNAKGTLKCLDVSGKGKTAVTGNKVSNAYWPIWQGANRDAKSTDTGLLKKWPEVGPELLYTLLSLLNNARSPQSLS